MRGQGEVLRPQGGGEAGRRHQWGGPLFPCLGVGGSAGHGPRGEVGTALGSEGPGQAELGTTAPIAVPMGADVLDVR